MPAPKPAQASDHWRLDGTAHWVANGSEVDEIAIVALVGDGAGVFVVPADHVALATADTLDRQVSTG